jgi:hypothetical protein
MFRNFSRRKTTMNIKGYRAALLTVAGLALVASSAVATPSPDGIVFNTRIFDDCPFSTLTTTDNFPSSIVIDDANLSCGGFANLHTWTFAVGGADAVFNNDSWFSFSADLVVSGTSEGEAGLRISPWWSPYVDGRVNVRTTDGEIACFGGRLPFFSFTGAFGLRYTKGEVINIEMVYQAQSLTAANPAFVVYNLLYDGMSYTSGPLVFDEGNPLSRTVPGACWTTAALVASSSRSCRPAIPPRS